MFNAVIHAYPVPPGGCNQASTTVRQWSYSMSRVTVHWLLPDTVSIVHTLPHHDVIPL